ncbi:hypothetical protein G7046_g6184 [Stylonectria norvegica]|nr:hypothetical protein G7046_g6184 [Stylonectria norvegica]
MRAYPTCDAASDEGSQPSTQSANPSFGATAVVFINNKRVAGQPSLAHLSFGVNGSKNYRIAEPNLTGHSKLLGGPASTATKFNVIRGNWSSSIGHTALAYLIQHDKRRMHTLSRPARNSLPSWPGKCRSGNSPSGSFLSPSDPLVLSKGGSLQIRTGDHDLCCLLPDLRETNPDPC